MCLAMPMKVKKISGDSAEVEAGKFRRTVNIRMCPKIKAGDYIIVHAGFAIEVVDPVKARETIKLLKEYSLKR